MLGIGHGFMPIGLMNDRTDPAYPGPCCATVACHKADFVLPIVFALQKRHSHALV